MSGKLSGEVEKSVLSVLEKRGSLPSNMAEVRAINYIQSGLVDSLGLMNIVVELETLFDVELLESDFMSEQFRTIGGLIDTMQIVVDRTRLNNK